MRVFVRGGERRTREVRALLCFARRTKKLTLLLGGLGGLAVSCTTYRGGFLTGAIKINTG